MFKELLKSIRYDSADYKLLAELDEIIAGNRRKQLNKLCHASLHPRGIKELASPKELRILYAMIKVLDSSEIESESVEQRIIALRALKDEVIDGNSSSLRNNTARVLLQIMKHLIRNGHSREQRLNLAHDLRMALLGQPRFIRRQLRKYHLLEMPEAWNQLSFDDHVHDVSTKGRKTPTHLIMDSWIKGIRQLQVVYYGSVPPLAARELLFAAEIMGVKVRIGVELPSKFRGRIISMIWAPRGFSCAENFLDFLKKTEVKEFFQTCSEIKHWECQLVLEQLSSFNAEKRQEMNEFYGVEAPALEAENFLKYVGVGQPSLLHLSEYIVQSYTDLLQQKERNDQKSPTLEDVHQQIVASKPYSTLNEVDSLPEIMRLGVGELSRRLCNLPAGNRITLNLSGCTLADVIEAVFASDGRITHLEMFNLKDYKERGIDVIAKINSFRQALNQGNVIKLKQIILETAAQLESLEEPESGSQAEQLKSFISQLPVLINAYSKKPLAARIGSDSTGRYRHLHGMGLVVMDSLSRSVRRRIKYGYEKSREIIPVKAGVSCYNRITARKSRISWQDRLLVISRSLGGLFGLGYTKSREWRMDNPARNIGVKGNIVTLGGYFDKASRPQTVSLRERWSRLNSNFKIGLKVLLGFIPAFLTFFFTKDWWLLSWGGAFIWLGITGIRNVIQSVLGGGGMKRSDLLKWNDFISWQRVADSLLYTGLSVPLLDLLVKTLLLQRFLGLTAEGNPVLVYSAMAFINGCYISGHNIFRGLPATAASANFFRSILSIPIAILFSSIFSSILSLLQVPSHGAIVQQWAAVISKLASDCVAGVIEGYADRLKNISQRLRDYKLKISQLFSTYSKLELMFPDRNVAEMMKSTKVIIRAVAEKEQDLERQLIVNALDMLYFRMYQPQAANAMAIVMSELDHEERDILTRSQFVLKREKEISQMFIDGLVGKNFGKPLAFYLEHYRQYLSAMEKVEKTKNSIRMSEDIYINKNEKVKEYGIS